MELYVSKFITISSKKVLGNNSSEIHFVGSNLCFPFVDDEENLTMESKYSVDIKHIKSEIDSVKNISKTMLIKNGEPCLQSLGLKTLAKYLKEKGFFVALETYGTKPNLIESMINNKLVDVVTLKLYTPLQDNWLKKLNKCSLKTDYKDIIENIKKTIKIMGESKIKVNVRTIVVPSLVYRKSDLNSIVKNVIGINNFTYELVAFDPTKCGKVYSKVNAPTEDFMNEMKLDLEQKFPSLRIR